MKTLEHRHRGRLDPRRPLSLSLQILLLSRIPLNFKLHSHSITSHHTRTLTHLSTKMKNQRRTKTRRMKNHKSFLGLQPPFALIHPCHPTSVIAHLLEVPRILASLQLQHRQSHLPNPSLGLPHLLLSTSPIPGPYLLHRPSLLLIRPLPPTLNNFRRQVVVYLGDTLFNHLLPLPEAMHHTQHLYRGHR